MNPLKLILSPLQNLLQSPWGWEKGRSRRREGSYSGTESDEGSARLRSPSPATPVRQGDGGPTHRQRSSSADGEAKPAHPQARATVPAGDRKAGQGERHGKSSAAAGRPVSAPVQVLASLHHGSWAACGRLLPLLSGVAACTLLCCLLLHHRLLLSCQQVWTLQYIYIFYSSCRWAINFGLDTSYIPFSVFPVYDEVFEPNLPHCRRE